MTRRKRKNWYKYIIILLLLISVAGVGYFVWDVFLREEPETVLGPEAEEPDEPVIEQETPSKPNDEEDGKIDGKEEVKQYDGGNPNSNAGLTGVITYAERDSDGNLVVRANIDQYLTNGECKLEIEQGGAVVYTEKVEIVDSASTSTCKGFNVAANKLPNGKINIKISVTAEGKIGIIEGEVN